MTGALAAAFWSLVRVGGADECWEWLGPRRHGTAYGVLQFCRQRLNATHVALELSGVMIGDGLFACHRCDNPPCVNPAHLFVGTQTDNMRDAAGKGHVHRGGRVTGARPRGETIGTSKLTEAQVVEIRILRANGERPFIIAKRFGLSPDYVTILAEGRSWKHVGGPRTEPRPTSTPVLTRACVIEARRSIADGTATLRALGRKYGVSAKTVSDAVYGETWKHVPGALFNPRCKTCRAEVANGA